MPSQIPELSPALSERTRKALMLANQEAHRLNHDAVGTEHLLLGLAKEAFSLSARVMDGLGYSLFWLRRRVEKIHPPAPAGLALPGILPIRDELASFLTVVIESVEARGTLPVTPEHLLAGLVGDRRGVSARILGRRWLSLWLLRRALFSIGS